MDYIATTMGNLVHQTAFFNLTYGNFIMIAVAFFFLYLAIKWGFEPLLLVPIAFGMLLVNIYPDIMADPSETSNGVGGLTQGSVINFASGAGLFGNYGQCAYAAAKEGIRGLTRVAANEWGPDGINANIICPLAWTAQLENFQQAYPEAFEANVKMPPAGHYGDVEKEIGRVCVQLASPDFKYMNGETLTLEGGMGLRP